MWTVFVAALIALGMLAQLMAIRAHLDAGNGAGFAFRSIVFAAHAALLCWWLQP